MEQCISAVTHVETLNHTTARIAWCPCLATMSTVLEIGSKLTEYGAGAGALPHPVGAAGGAE